MIKWVYKTVQDCKIYLVKSSSRYFVLKFQTYFQVRAFSIPLRFSDPPHKDDFILFYGLKKVHLSYDFRLWSSRYELASCIWLDLTSDRTSWLSYRERLARPPHKKWKIIESIWLVEIVHDLDYETFFNSNTLLCLYN